MLKRIWKTPSRANRHDAGSRAFAGRSRRTLMLEVLEARQLLDRLAGSRSAMSPSPLSSGIRFPRRQRDHQSHPDVHGDLEQPRHQGLGGLRDSSGRSPSTIHRPTSSDVTITNEKMTFQLFSDLTPTTVTRITTLTNANYLHDDGLSQLRLRRLPPGKFIPRITYAWPTRSSPRSREDQAARQHGLVERDDAHRHRAGPAACLHRPNQLAMANTGQPNSTDAQFFITNGRSLDVQSSSLRLQLHDLRPAGLRPANGDRPDQGGRVRRIRRARTRSSYAGDDHRGHAFLAESQRRSAHRHHLGQGGRDSHDHGHGHRPLRSDHGHANLHGHGWRLQRADQSGDQLHTLRQPRHRHASSEYPHDRPAHGQ